MSAFAVWLLACSAADPGKTEIAAQGSGTPSAESPVEVAAAPLPESVPDLLTLVPKSASTVISLPSLTSLKKSFDASQVDLLEEAAAEYSARVGLTPALVKKVLTGFGGGVVFVDGQPLGPTAAAAAVVRIDDDSLIAPLVEAAKLEQTGPDRWASDTMHVAWLAKAKVAVIASSAGTIERALALAAGTGDPFSASPLYRKRGPNAIWVASDVGAVGKELGGGAIDAGSALFATFDLDKGALEIETIHNSEAVPRIGLVMAPTALGTLGKLPSGAIGAVGLSIKRAPQRSLRDVARELLRSQGRDVTGEIESSLKERANLTLAELDRALGDEAVLGFYYEGGPMVKPEEALRQSGALLANVAIRDEKVARSVIDLFAKELRLKSTPGKLRIDKNGLTLDVSTTTSQVVIAFGASAMMGKLKAAPKQTLGADAGFMGARKTAPAEANMLAYADFARLLKVLPEESRAQLSSSPLSPIMVALEAKPNEKGLHLLATSAGGQAVVATVGSLAAVGINGVRRYLNAAKTAEAKNTLAAIGRGAIGAYERESLAPNAPHALCKSAQPVPATVPAGKRYQPNDKPGADYGTGSQLGGWKCLKFALTTSQYYQYDYRVGGGYKGPKRGLPDPGKDGFEASAEGDLDGDGKTSLFTLTGKVENGSVKLSTQLNIADEFE